MKFLVTGSSGFVGRRLCKSLYQQGHSLSLVLREGEKKEKDIYVCNLKNECLPEEAFEGVDTVFHLAGYAHDLKNSKKLEHDYYLTNVVATRNLFKSSSEMGIKNFIFISSVKAGCSDASERDSEETPQGVYGETKRKAELELLEFSNQTDMKVFIIRPSLVYGPKIRGNLLSMKKAIEAGWFPPLPIIQNVRSMVHVDDLVRAILLVKEKGISGEIYNVTDGKDYSTTEIYETFCSVLRKELPKLRVPFFMLKLLGLIPGRLSYKINKLIGDEKYSSSKIETLGFSAKLRFGDLNETLF